MVICLESYTTHIHHQSCKNKSVVVTVQLSTQFHFSFFICFTLPNHLKTPRKGPPLITSHRFISIYTTPLLLSSVFFFPHLYCHSHLGFSSNLLLFFAPFFFFFFLFVFVLSFPPLKDHFRYFLFSVILLIPIWVFLLDLCAWFSHNCFYHLHLVNLIIWSSSLYSLLSTKSP